MKHQVMKCSRWRLQWQSLLICVPAAMLFFVLSAQAQVFIPPAQTDAILPPIGGGGGGQFVFPCIEGQLIAGFEIRAADDVDAIRPLCVIALGPSVRSHPIFTLGSGLITPGNSLFEKPQLEVGWYGGTGGGLKVVLCPSDAPFVNGMYIGYGGESTIIVNSIHLFCGTAATTQKPSEFPSAVFDGAATRANHSSGKQYCPAGLGAVGINGRSGIWLDSLGLICGAPKLVPKDGLPFKGLGSALGSAKAPPKIEYSDSDNARNTSPYKAPPTIQYSDSDNVRNTSPYGVPGGVKAPVTVSAQDDLAVKGEALANEDPLAAELRNREPGGPSRRGFDIGLAAAEGQTMPGPSKQRFHDSLSRAEQEGFDTAVSFSLERNRNADLAARGAAIAKADPVVAGARTVETDVFYWLGFDIATGIFGDPALGAQGNTATGPNSLRIRDSLSAAGRRGFNASVKLHLSRNYKP